MATPIPVPFATNLIWTLGRSLPLPSGPRKPIIGKDADGKVHAAYFLQGFNFIDVTAEYYAREPQSAPQRVLS